MLIDQRLAKLVAPLCDHPESIVVKTVEGRDTMVLEFAVHESDFGRVLGKRGQMIDALRYLLAAAAEKKGWKLVVKLKRPDRRAEPTENQSEIKEVWDQNAFRELLLLAVEPWAGRVRLEDKRADTVAEISGTPRHEGISLYAHVLGWRFGRHVGVSFV